MVLAAVAALFSSSAFADNCPSVMKRIDAAMGGDLDPPLRGDQIDEVKRLRKEAEALHNEGKHEASMAKLDQIRKMMGI
ncbi:MAG: hypothetical protein KDG52_20220 [Rhodocyclaceae bacterium]|nr:hypothetical protein [Rhodocyclaceae bacterium]